MADQDYSAGAQVSRLGGEMRAAREKLGYELPDLALSLRIRLSHLEAIEAGRLHDLPGTTYALGFVRAYAVALGLPEDEMAKRFKAEAHAIPSRPQLSFPAPVPQGGVPAGAVMLLGVIILAVAYGGWYVTTAHYAAPPQIVPPIPPRLAQKLPDVPPPSPQVASILPGTAPPAPKPQGQSDGMRLPQIKPVPLAKPDSAPPPPNAPLSPSLEVPVAVAPTSPATAPTATPADTNPANHADSAVPTAPAVGEAVPPGHRIVLQFTADTWVMIRQKGQTPILNQTMHAGDQFEVPGDQQGLLLTTGNAGGTDMVVDGKDMGAMGGAGGVRRDVALDPDALKTGDWQLKHKPKPAAPAKGTADGGDQAPSDQSAPDQ